MQSWGPQHRFPVAVPSPGCPRGTPLTQSEGDPPRLLGGSAGTRPSGLQGRGQRDALGVPVAQLKSAAPHPVTAFVSGQALIWWVSRSGRAHHRGLVAGWSRGCPAAGPGSHRRMCRCLSPLAWRLHAADGNAASPAAVAAAPGCPRHAVPCRRRRPLHGALAQPRSLPSSSDSFTPANKL